MFIFCRCREAVTTGCVCKRLDAYLQVAINVLINVVKSNRNREPNPPVVGARLNKLQECTQVTYYSRTVATGEMQKQEEITFQVFSHVGYFVSSVVIMILYSV
jgi:hypothetical protein